MVSSKPSLTTKIVDRKNTSKVTETFAMPKFTQSPLNANLPKRSTKKDFHNVYVRALFAWLERDQALSAGEKRTDVKPYNTAIAAMAYWLVYWPARIGLTLKDIASRLKSVFFRSPDEPKSYGHYGPRIGAAIAYWLLYWPVRLAMKRGETELYEDSLQFNCKTEGGKAFPMYFWGANNLSPEDQQALEQLQKCSPGKRLALLESLRVRSRKGAFNNLVCALPGYGGNAGGYAPHIRAYRQAGFSVICPLAPAHRPLTWKHYGSATILIGTLALLRDGLLSLLPAWLSSRAFRAPIPDWQDVAKQTGKLSSEQRPFSGVLAQCFAATPIWLEHAKENGHFYFNAQFLLSPPYNLIVFLYDECRNILKLPKESRTEKVVAQWVAWSSGVGNNVRKLWQDFSLETVAPRMRVPTLIAFPPEDNWAPHDKGVELAKKIGASEMHFISTPGHGHGSVVFDPRIVRLGVEFFKAKNRSLGAQHFSPTILERCCKIAEKTKQTQKKHWYVMPKQEDAVQAPPVMEKKSVRESARKLKHAKIMEKQHQHALLELKFLTRLLVKKRSFQNVSIRNAPQKSQTSSKQQIFTLSRVNNSAIFSK